MKTENVSLVVRFANLTNYEQLLVFVRYGSRPDLANNVFDSKYMVNVKREYPGVG